MIRHDGGPAFPVENDGFHDGLSKLEYLAGEAMKALMASGDIEEMLAVAGLDSASYHSKPSMERATMREVAISVCAYRQARAMLLARSEHSLPGIEVSPGSYADFRIAQDAANDPLAGTFTMPGLPVNSIPTDLQ